MDILNPSAFWGLIVLLVPTIVLLLSKKKQDLVNFPSLQFLTESESKSARSIFPTQWLLWLLRVVLISLLVLLLARPIFDSSSNDKKVYIEKEVFEDESFASVLSSLDSEVEVVEPESLWILAEKLSASADSSIVYTRNYAKDFIGKPVELGSHVSWLIVPNAASSEILDTAEINSEAFETEIVTGELGLKWTSNKLESTINFADNPTSIKIISSSKSEKSKEKLTSILNAYSKVLPLTIDFGKESSEWLITIDTLLAKKGQKLLEWDYLEGPLGLEEVGPDYNRMKGELSAENLEGSDFALQLAHLLVADKMGLDSLDRRINPAPIQKIAEARQASMDKSERKYYWWSLILVLVLMERWYSRKLTGV